MTRRGANDRVGGLESGRGPLAGSDGTEKPSTASSRDRSPHADRCWLRRLVAALGILTVAILLAPPSHAGDGNGGWISIRSENTKPVREVGYGQIRYAGHGPEYWHWRYLEERQALLERTSTKEALQLSAIAYRVPYSLLYRKASCESTGGRGLNPNAKNKSSTAAGLGQFLDSTWASTPYARFSVFDPLANALAMGWMHHAGRGGQWAASRGCWG